MQVKVETKKKRIAILMFIFCLICFFREDNKKFNNSTSNENENLKKEIAELSQ